MHKILIFILLCCSIFSGDVFAAPKKVSGTKQIDSAKTAMATVDYIVDGDTFGATVLLADDIKISVRLRILDIDTPEMSGECDAEIKMAIRARDRLAELIPVGTIVELRDIKDDKYLGRIDARVTSANGINVSRVLIDEKLARPYSGKKRLSWCGPGDQFVY